MQSPADEIRNLKACINDLISVLALPALWTGREPSQILTTLLDVLLSMLRLDFVYARLSHSSGAHPLEVVRLKGVPNQAVHPEEIGHRLEPSLTGDQAKSFMIASPIGAGAMFVTVLPLGVQHGFEVLVAGSQRSDFPTETERVLLQVAANQAAIGLEEARRSGEQRRVAEELDERVTERTKQLIAVNEELRKENLERKRVQEALRQSEEQWRDVFEHNPTMYFIVDPNGIVLSVNPFGAGQLGYTIDELVGDSVLKIIEESDREAAKKSMLRCLDQPGRSMSWELRKIRKNRTLLWVRETGRAVVRASGPIVLIACEDVTERKRAEVELAKAEQRLRAVIATAPIILFALDRSGVCTLSEGEGLDDLGLKPGQVVGQSVFDLYRDAPQVPSAVRRALAGETFTELLEVNDQILETHYIPVFDGEQVAGINGVAINITQHKRAEDSLRNIQAELAHMARVTMLGEMTALIAHETNQPLGAMVNNANACLRWLAANNLDEARHSAELIRADGYRAAEIINRIRSFAKKAPPQKDWIEINETIREVSALARSEIQRHGIALEMQLSSDFGNLPLIFADRIQLQQVILNLLMNAVEAMSENTDRRRELLVRTGVDESGGIMVAVRDSGPGVAPENLAHLFTPFYTTKPQGMGMGLAICRSIIEAHGGRLWVTTNDDTGATFQFILPSEGEGTPRLA